MRETLRADAITVRFGGLTALSDVSLELMPATILGLIGPNGAGKTTLVNVLSGFQAPQHGRVLLGEADISRQTPPIRSREGIVRTFQGARLFPSLTVIENALIGALARGIGRAAALDLAWDALERFELADVANEPAASLPYGRERMLSLARAIVARPRFLLVDEPAAGLNEVEIEHLGSIVKELCGEFGFGLLLIEHHIGLVMAVCDEVQVLVKGSTLRCGAPGEIQNDPEVVAAYLGE